MNKVQIFDTLEKSWQTYLICKSYFPSIPETAVTSTKLFPGPFYLKTGYKLEFMYPNGIALEQIQISNNIGHWINQNFIIRLYSILDYFEIFNIFHNEKINKILKPEHTELDLVRRLRIYFAHKTGDFDPNNSDEMKTKQILIEKFHLNPDNYVGMPLPIDTVITPLYEGCKEYINEL